MQLYPNTGNVPKVSYKIRLNPSNNKVYALMYGNNHRW